MRLTAVQRISGISIHAPREGSDRSHWLTLNITRIISIHAPREGSDVGRYSPAAVFWYFYPRSPRGERRSHQMHPVFVVGVISIHAPREGSDDVNPGWVIIEGPISIHAPREGSDADNFSGKVSSLGFLSTLPARGATVTKS